MSANYEMIPAELRELKQWVVWRAVQLADGRTSKPPYQGKNPEYRANVKKPETWCTFEEAVLATIYHPSQAHGIGFVFTDGDDYFGLDIDDEDEVAAENMSQRQEFIEMIQHNLFTYCEYSPSGKGLHYIGRGKSKFKGRRSSALKLELYAKERFFTMTGERVGNMIEITEQQPFLDAFFANYNEELEEHALADTEVERSVDLSDDEVIAAAARNPSFLDYFHARKGHLVGEWSTTFFFVLAELDRVTGSVDQIKRIILNSPLVLEAPAGANGEKRIDKAKRTIDKDLRRARQGNENGQYSLYHVNFGREVAKAIQEAAKEHAKEQIKKLNNPKITRGKIDQLLEFFPDFKDYYERLTLPPGEAGLFVAAAARASKVPALKFAISSTFAALSALLGRRYKLTLGGGVNLNFILAAPPASGKSVSLSVWEQAISEAYEAQHNQLMGQPKVPCFSMSTSSIQGVWKHFMDTPCALWLCDEAGGMVNAMQEGQSEGARRLKQAFNSLYDASKHSRISNPVASAEGQKRGDAGIRNLNVSTYWVMTHSQLKIEEDDILDGFLSRVIVVYDDKHEDKKIRDSEIVPISRDLKDKLSAIVNYAMQLNHAYDVAEQSAGDLMMYIDTSLIREFSWDIEQRVEHIAMSANAGQMPIVYATISRLHSNAMRLAGVMAVMENPYAPAVTIEQFKWAFGYLMFNLANVLRAVDSGKLGHGTTDEMLALVRAMKLLAEKNPNGIPRTLLREELKRQKAFRKRTDSQSMAKQITDGIEQAIKEGIILLETVTKEGAKKPTQLLFPNMDDPIWSNV